MNGQAPKVYHSAKKGDGRFVQIPLDLLDKLFAKLDGRHGNAIKLMIELLGIKGDGSFRLAPKWICDRTHMTKQKYFETLKYLEEWQLVQRIDDGIIVNIDRIKNAGDDHRHEQKYTRDGKNGHQDDENHNRHDDHNIENNKEKKKKETDKCMPSKENDSEIEQLLSSIGVNYSSYTRKELNHAAGEDLDPCVLRELIRKNQPTWIRGKCEGQNYCYIALKQIIKNHYQRAKRDLEGERMAAEQEREERKKHPRIDYDLLTSFRDSQETEGLDDISYLLDDDDDDEPECSKDYDPAKLLRTLEAMKQERMERGELVN